MAGSAASALEAYGTPGASGTLAATGTPGASGTPQAFGSLEATGTPNSLQKKLHKISTKPVTYPIKHPYNILRCD